MDRQTRLRLCQVLYFAGFLVVIGSWVGGLPVKVGWIGWGIGIVGWIAWPRNR
jgi:hypothetical protein